MSDHPPIHSPKGVEYWDEGLQEYILDETPDINLRPAPEFRTKEFRVQPMKIKEHNQ